MVEALQAEWNLHPPVHHLVASYLGHKPAAVVQATTDAEVAAHPAGLPGTSGLPPPPGLTLDSTRDEALDAFGRMFYGDIKNGRDL